MCKICEIASTNSEYLSLLEKMVGEDQERLKTTNEFLDQYPSLSKNLYTSLKWPTTFSTPLFEARAAFAIPTKYFQPILLDGERMGNHFAHGATRSVFFSGDKLVLLSKTIGQEVGRPFLSSFLFTHFDKGEYDVAFDGKDMKISVDVEKPLKNLITGKVEKKKIHFNFFHQNLEGRIISKEQAMQSSYVKKTLGKRGNVRTLFASADLEGYVVSVSHFSPHPFMLRLCKQFGYESFRQFQEHSLDYFREHLKLKPPEEKSSI
jgi:hypothetical protein